MFALLDEQQEVKDDPDAEDLVITEGRVDFKNVFFSYDNKVPVLNDVRILLIVYVPSMISLTVQLIS